MSESAPALGIPEKNWAMSQKVFSKKFWLNSRLLYRFIPCVFQTPYPQLAHSERPASGGWRGGWGLPGSGRGLSNTQRRQRRVGGGGDETQEGGAGACYDRFPLQPGWKMSASGCWGEVQSDWWVSTVQASQWHASNHFVYHGMLSQTLQNGLRASCVLLCVIL